MKSIETRGIITKHTKTSARVLLPKAFQVLEGKEATITVLVSDEQFEEYSKSVETNSRKISKN